MNTVMVRNLEMGAGAPKIIVPIVAKTREGILEKAAELKNYTMDLVEWRADFYEDALDVEKTVETAELLNKALGELPLLYTFRTALEGGNKEITPIHYTALNKAVAESGFVDIIDVESNTPRIEADENIRNIHAAHLPVIGSYHNTDDNHQCYNCHNCNNGWTIFLNNFLHVKYSFSFWIFVTVPILDSRKRDFH